MHVYTECVPRTVEYINAELHVFLNFAYTCIKIASVFIRPRSLFKTFPFFIVNDIITLQCNPGVCREMFLLLLYRISVHNYVSFVHDKITATLLYIIDNN